MTRARSLRWRMIALLVIIVTATNVVVGAVTVVALRAYLFDQVDQRLTASSQRAVHDQGRVPSDGGPAPGFDSGGDPNHAFIGAPGQSARTIVAIESNGSFVIAGFTDESGRQHSISSPVAAELKALPSNGKILTRSLDGLGSYRLVSTRTAGGEIFIIGVPLEAVDATISQLIVVILIVALVGTLLAAWAGALQVRRALRPLANVADTASAVTESALERGGDALTARVSDRDIAANDEVAQVGVALNRLLGNVANALAVRDEAERRVREFVADASHELRTPLATIRAYAELSQRDYAQASAALQRNVDRIDTEAIRMTALVEELLLLARLDSAATPDRADVDVSQLVAESLTDAHTAGSDHSWNLELDDEPVIVRGDPAQLRRVVINLLANARIHTPAGTSVTARVRAEATDAVVQVADSGPGIDAAQLPTLFERFTRADGSRTRATGSTGLGLAIVRAVVESHAGTVDVQSDERGTCFTVRIPRLAPAD